MFSPSLPSLSFFSFSSLRNYWGFFPYVSEIKNITFLLPLLSLYPAVLFIQSQRLCHRPTGWRCNMLSFRLFLIGATNSAEIFSRRLLNPSNCIYHLLPPPYPHVTEFTFRLRRATTYPRPRNRILTATNLSLITSS